MLSIGLLCGLLTAARAQTGIIGINTDNPQGVLHIDGASTTETTNPAASEGSIISAGQATDDVVVDASGRVGVGLLAPEIKTKLDILPSSTAGSILRIADGTQGAGKYLFSDDDGTGTWALTAVGSWYAALYDSPMLGDRGETLGVRTFTGYTGSLISLASGGGNPNASAGTITIPATGKYRISISIYWETTRGVPFKPTGVLRLNRSGSVSDLWTFFSWAGAYSDANVLPTFITIRNLNAGDVLSLATDESALINPSNARAVLFMVELLL